MKSVYATIQSTFNCKHRSTRIINFEPKMTIDCIKRL